jgi:cytochrome b subunit of formate dehydrogenase
MPDSDCLLCHSDPDLTRTLPDGRELSLFVDETRFRASVHGANQCADCHSDIESGHPDDGLTPGRVDCADCHFEQSDSYNASVHGRALRDGMPGAAGCSDCHGHHEVLSPRLVTSPTHPSHLAATCGTCHPDVARDIDASVHGEALRAGRRDAPTCTDCHFEHQIEGLRGLSPMRAAEQTCSRCHASERINARYRMPDNRVRTFLGSYHGLAARLGSTRAANCASCHSYHRILPSTNPESSIHPNHLVQTCGQCHPGATENFALGKVHAGLDDDDLGAQVNRWVRRIYLVLIFLTIGVFVLHNALIWWRKALAARRAQLTHPTHLTVSQRIQHAVLAISFIILAISGFALQFPDSWLAWLMGSNEDIRRWTHRAAAIVIIGLAFYHLGYLVLTPEGRRLLRELWPQRQDIREVRHNTAFACGRQPRQARPPGRFGYIEKIEYWAVVWGTLIMGVTGLIVWFPVQVTWFLPRWIVDVATTIHYYEAILACLAILVWHGYHVFLDPDVYPLNWAFWNGRAPHPPQPQKTAATKIPDSSY